MMNGIPWDYINKIRAGYGMPKIDRDGKVKQKHIKSWPPGFADLKLKDGVYQEG